MGNLMQPVRSDLDPASKAAANSTSVRPSRGRRGALSTMRGGISASVVLKLMGLAAILGSWQLYSVTTGSAVIPGFGDITRRFLQMWRNDTLVADTIITVQRGFLGLGIGFVAALVIGIALAASRLTRVVLQPLVDVLYPIPKLALYPIVILSAGLGARSEVAQVALECFFPILVQIYAGASSVDRELSWLARNTEAGPLRVARDITIPHTLPFIFTALRIAMPIMLIVITVTEQIAGSAGLGALLMKRAAYFDSAGLFAIVFFLGFLGLLFDRIVVLIRARVVFWERMRAR